MADDATVGPPRLVVGLTGGIASGKSLVGAMFVKLGASLIDTDVVAREVVALGEPGLAAVAAEFGPRVLLPSGELNRPAVRSLVFADEAKRRSIELARRQQDARPEFRGHGRKAGLAKRHDLARHDVRVDERGPELHEHRAHERFAAGDAAR